MSYFHLIQLKVFHWFPLCPMGSLKVYCLIFKSSTVVRTYTLFNFRTSKIVETYILLLSLLFFNHGCLVQQSKKLNAILIPMPHNIKILEYFKADQLPVYLYNIVLIILVFLFTLHTRDYSCFILALALYVKLSYVLAVLFGHHSFISGCHSGLLSLLSEFIFFKKNFKTRNW